MTIAEILDALENALTRDMSWWDEAHGHTESFRIGTLNGLSTAVAKIILLRAQLPPIMATDHNAEAPVMASGDDVALTDAESEQDRAAWDEDEADMARIAREWAEYDRDPPGS